MSTVRKIPQSVTGSLKALTTAKTKKDGIVAPAVNILSDTTSSRLDLDLVAFKTSGNNVIATKAAYHMAISLAKPQRILLKSYITNFYNNVNDNIKIGKIPVEARTFYDLNITNKKMPLMATDVDLLLAADKLIIGDTLRVEGGGIAITSPTIVQFTSILSTARPILLAISNAHTLVSTAKLLLDKQLPEIKDLITHIWDEVEAYYSLSTASNRRTHAREWGVKYLSNGIMSVVTGTCKDGAGAVLVGIKVRIIGASISTLSNALGDFSLNTSLYGDLELEATNINYEKNTIEFTKEDGIAAVVAVVMTKI